jgi:hypothetical protein
MPWDAPAPAALAGRSGASGAAMASSPVLPADFVEESQATAMRERVSARPLAKEPELRPATLTTELAAAQARAVRPPDVARQAISELGVLAGQLASLAEELESSGLARIHYAAYFEVLRRYLSLARQAWLSVAAERLEQDGASPDYRQRAISVARDVTRLRRECEVVASNEQFPLPRRTPWRWGRRARLMTEALRAWQAGLSAPADPERMGVALFDLRGALQLAMAGGLELTLLDTLSVASRWLVGAVAVASGLALAGAALMDQTERAAGFGVITVMTLIGWLALLLLISRSLGALPELLAGASFSETYSALNGRMGSRAMGGALRAWWLICGTLGVALTLAGLVVGVVFVSQAPEAQQALALLQQGGGATVGAGGWLALVGDLLAKLLVPATLASALAVVALAIPVLLVSAARCVGELTGSRRWSPGARRYALQAATSSIAWLGGALVGLVWLYSARAGLDAMTLTRFSVAGIPVVISARAIALAGALALPWLLIEEPFRIGVGRWRRAWLHDLRTRKNATESHVRRLSAPDPHTGAQDTSEETLRAMQYDLVLLQFYIARIEEAERASSSPLSRSSALVLIAFILAAALVLDAGSGALLHALQGAVGL